MNEEEAHEPLGVRAETTNTNQEVNAPTNVTEQENMPPPTTDSPKKNKKPRNKKLFIVIGIVLLLLVIGVVFLLLNKSDSSKNNAETTSPTSRTPTTETNETKEKEVVGQTTLTGNTFLSVPKVLADLKFIDPNIALLEPGDTYTYYLIGTTEKNKQIIVAHYDPQTIDGPVSFLFIESDTQPNAGQTYKYSPQLGELSENIIKAFPPSVTYDPNVRLSELNFPSETTVAGQKIKTTYTKPEFSPKSILNEISFTTTNGTEGTSTPKKIGDVSAYTLYKRIYKTTANYQIVEMYAILADMFKATYFLNGELSATNDNLPITWSSGDNSAIKAFSGGAGCGSQGYIITSVNAATLKQIGTSKAGQKIYQLPLDAPLVKELYEEDYNKGEFLPEGDPLKNLTLQQFVDKHAYFLAENGFGEYVVFQRSDMFLRGGCGKPVVYLYPTVPTRVNVLVGADVVLSEPYYEKDGWQNVFAAPNGELAYRGNIYSSLYWEGYGHGEYPEITEGRVVERARAPEVMRADLLAQGFIAKEIDDFMEFWEPRLPDTPYVRLTWFGTQAMNKLAPLTISPAPQTVIRTFLDFEGMQAPIAMKAQRFNAPARNGFTATEWGGLLREGIR